MLEQIIGLIWKFEQRSSRDAIKDHSCRPKVYGICSRQTRLIRRPHRVHGRLEEVLHLLTLLGPYTRRPTIGRSTGADTFQALGRRDS